MAPVGRDRDAMARYPLKRRPDRPKRVGEENSLVQLKPSIALAVLACAVAGCAPNVIPEAALPPPPTPWAVDIAQNVPEPLSVGKAQNVVPEPSPKPDDK